MLQPRFIAQACSESWGHGWTFIPLLARNRARVTHDESCRYLTGRVRSRE
jgi:hypothetical protein